MFYRCKDQHPFTAWIYTFIPSTLNTPHKLPVLGPNEIRKRLRLLVGMMPIRVSMRMRVVGRADVVHFEDVAAFGTALDGAGTGHLLGGVSRLHVRQGN